MYYCTPQTRFGVYNATVHKFSKKSRNHFKILGGRRVARLPTENLQSLSAMAKKLVDMIQNIVTTATWRPAFVHP